MPKKKPTGPRTLAPTAPLTNDQPERKITYPGQASWADPSIKRICRECGLYDISAGRYTSGRLKNGRCKKTAELGLKDAPAFPAWAFACKYYEENPQPPTMFEVPDRFTWLKE